MDIGDSFLASKTVQAWGWPLISILFNGFSITVAFVIFFNFNFQIHSTVKHVIWKLQV